MRGTTESFKTDRRVFSVSVVSYVCCCGYFDLVTSYFTKYRLTSGIKSKASPS